MPDRLPDAVTLLVGLSAFVLFFAVWSAAVVLWARRRAASGARLDDRLRPPASEHQSTRTLRLWHEGREATATVPQAERRPFLTGRLGQLLEDAGWTGMYPGRVILMFASLCVGISALTFALADSVMLGLGITAFAIAVFWIVAQQAVRRQVALFEQQLADALQLAARSLRVGHSIVRAFRLVSEEFPPPVGTVFSEICQQQELGMGMQEALGKAAAESSSSDMKLLATSVVIQLRTGGNLADMMDRVALVIRERIRLNRRVRVLTAQTQFSKRILLVLPVFMFLLLNVMHREYMEPLYTQSAGRAMLGVAVGLLVVGGWIMNRMAVLRY